MSEWRNRIIDTVIVEAEELQNHPDNWRIHPEIQRKAVAGLLDEVGIVDRLKAYYSERYGGLTLLNGHLRKGLGGQWPVDILDLTDEEADLVLATFDSTTGLAEMDTQALAELLGRVEMTPVEDESLEQFLTALEGKTGTDAIDPIEEWQGMPEFEHEDLTAFRTIKVNLASQKDVDDFSEIVGQKITEKTKSVWYPKQETIRYGEVHES